MTIVSISVPEDLLTRFDEVLTDGFQIALGRLAGIHARVRG